MGFVSWYDKRIRQGLEFSGVNKEAVQRHFDLYEKHGFTGFRIRCGEQVREMFSKANNPIIASANYMEYLYDRVEALFERRGERALVSIIDAVT